MKQPGLDGRHRDRDGRIDLKHSSTLNKHLSPPLPEFGPDVTLKQMREATGKISEADVRSEAKRLAALRLLQGRFTIAQFRAALAILAEKKQAPARGLSCHRAGAPRQPRQDGRTPPAFWLDPRGCRVGCGPLEAVLARGSRRQRTGHPRHKHHHAFSRATGKAEGGNRRGQAATGHPEAQKDNADRPHRAQVHDAATDQGLIHHLYPSLKMLDRLTQSGNPVQRAVRAAEGWLALGAAQATLEELAALEPSRQTIPTVLCQ